MRLFAAPLVFCLVRRGRHAEKFLRTRSIGDQKTMKAKLVIAFFLILICVSIVSVEYELARGFGILVNVFVSIFALFVLLGALLRAPEGYEDQNGFHIGARADVVAL
jgi:uncharacterized Tic20 family protein